MRMPKGGAGAEGAGRGPRKDDGKDGEGPATGDGEPSVKRDCNE